MQSPKIHTLKNKIGHYALFDGVRGFQEFVDYRIAVLNTHNRNIFHNLNQSTTKKLGSAPGTTWYGSPVPRDVSELNDHKYFLGMELLKKIYPRIKNKLEAYLKLLDDKVLTKPKVAYNDRGLGVFSFDRAAMGLYRLQPTGSKEPLPNTVSQLQIELDRGNKTTAVKSVYAYFKDRKSSYPALQVYLMAGGNANIKGDELLYVGLACTLLVEFMEVRGVAIEVNVLLGTSFRNKMVMSVIRVKRFQDKLDTNQLLLMTSDPRYFRYRGFKALIALSDYMGRNIPQGLGRIDPDMGKDFVQRISKEGSFRAVFEQSYSMNAAVKEVGTIIENYTSHIQKS